jgi:hypothetical protein
VAAIGPQGNVVVIWRTERSQGRKTSNSSTLAYGNADGHFTKPVQHATRGFFESFEDYGESHATVDSSGRAFIVFHSERKPESIDYAWMGVTVAPGGRIGAERRLPVPFYAELSLASNELGQTIVGEHGAVGRQSEIHVIFGTTAGFGTASESFRTPHDLFAGDVTLTLDEQRKATAIWCEGLLPGEGQPRVSARAITPGAQIVQVARSEPSS